MPQVLEIVGSFLQFYREDARYQERTAHWVERIGLERIKSVLIDDRERRQDYYLSFLLSQEKRQEDPWQQESVHKQFTPALSHEVGALT